jgi:hypothetical protein
MVQITHSNVDFQTLVFQGFQLFASINLMQSTNKEDKLVNGTSSNDCHECLIYDALNSRWFQSKNVMKHVNAFHKWN